MHGVVPGENLSRVIHFFVKMLYQLKYAMLRLLKTVMTFKLIVHKR